MVSDSHAWAFVQDSGDYVDEEHEAAAVVGSPAARAGCANQCRSVWASLAAPPLHRALEAPDANIVARQRGELDLKWRQARQ